MQRQGKWSSPGGHSKLFISFHNNVVITWYSKKQLTIEMDPPLKCKLVKLVHDEAEEANSFHVNVSRKHFIAIDEIERGMVAVASASM